MSLSEAEALSMLLEDEKKHDHLLDALDEKASALCLVSMSPW